MSGPAPTGRRAGADDRRRDAPSPRPLDRLRGRVALAAAVAASLALLAAGAFVLSSVTRADRDDLDRTLAARATQAATVGRRTLGGVAAGATGRPVERATRRVTRLLGRVPGGGDVALIRLVRGGVVLSTLGAGDAPGLPLAAPRVPTTVATASGDWRIVQRPMGRGVVVQAASPLAAQDARHATLRDRLLLAGVGGVLATGALAFLLAGPALAALTRLRHDAGRVAGTDDLGVRMRDDAGPVEVRELAGTLNAMLGRLARSDAERRDAFETTRRFAADAGHEVRTPLAALTTTVQALRTHPDLPAAEREAMLAEVAEEHARLVALLDALQALARGDAGARLERAPVDLAELADQAVGAARAAAPGVTFVLDAPATLVREGWAPGLRLALDNLLVNAVRHGRPDGHVHVTVAAVGAGDGGPGDAPGFPTTPGPPSDGAVLIVDDDGPGVPADERPAVLGRFARGRGAAGPGSGLGLAIVDQQAHLHGGRLTLGDAPAGGLRATFEMRGTPDGAPRP